MSIIIYLFIYSVVITVILIRTLIAKNMSQGENERLKKRIQELEKGAKPLVEEEPEPKPVTEASPAPAPVQNRTAAPLPAYTRTSVKAPAPAINTSAVRTTVRPENKPKDKKAGLGAVGVSFAIGVLLMVIAAAVFITATWQVMPAGFKCIVLTAVVAAVYGLCAFSRRKLKLEKTASVLYMLGTLITPIAILVGFMAFDFTEAVVILLACALSLGVSGFIGYKVFGTNLQVGISYFGFLWAEIFIMMEVLGNLTGFVLGITLAALVSGLIHYFFPKLKFFGVFAEVTAYASTVGLIMAWAGSSSKLNVYAVLLTQVFYWVSLLLLNRRRAFIKYFSALVPVALTLWLWFSVLIDGRTVYAVTVILITCALFAVYRLIKQDNPSSRAIISGGMALIMYLVSISHEVEELKDFLHYAALIMPIINFIAVIVMSRNKVERSVYTYLIALCAVVLSEDLIEGALPIYIFMGIVIASFVLSVKFRQVHIPAASVAAFILIQIMNIMDLDYYNIHLIIFGIVSVAIYGGTVFYNRFAKPGKSLHFSLRFSALALLVVSQIELLFSSFETDPEGLSIFVALIIADIAFVVITLFDTDNYFGILPAVTFTTSVAYRLIINDVDTMLVGVILMLVLVILGRIFVNEHIISKGRIDWLTFVGGIACMIPAKDPYKMTFLLSLYIMTFVGRFSSEDSVEERVKTKLRTLLSASVGMLAISFAIVKITYSDDYDLEIRLFFLLLAAFAIHFIIKPFMATRWIWFSTVAACIELEAFKALSGGKPLPLTLVSVCGIVIFIVSFIIKNRSWFILSIATITQLALVFAVAFWESMLWWVFLLVIGGILIGTASVNEYKRRVAIESGLEDKKIRLFDSWTW